MPRSRKPRKRVRKRPPKACTPDDNCYRCQLTNPTFVHNHSKPSCLFRPCHPCQELVQLNKEIEAAHEHLASLVRQRQAVNTRVNLQHDRLTLRLPIEIISDIFSLVADSLLLVEDDKTWNEEYKVPNRPPQFLGIICKQWRVITLEHPQLWSVLDLSYWDRNQSRFSMVEEWLRRASTAPLSVTYQEDYRSYCQYAHMHLRNILRSHAAQWKSFVYKGNRDNFHYLFDNLFDRIQLDTLSIDFGGHLPILGPAPQSKRIQFKEPPSPRSLYITNVRLHELPLQLNGLTHLEATHQRLDEVLYIIRHARCLVRCIIKNVQPVTPGEEFSEEPMTNIVHPFITYFDVEVSRDATEGVLVSCLTLPSLKTLRYRHEPNQPDWDLGTLVNFLDRSQATLETFLLVHIVLASGSSILPWLEGLPSVTHLEIWICDNLRLSTLLRSLSEPFGHHLTLPCLRELCIKFWDAIILDWADFCHFITVHSNRVKLCMQATESMQRDAARGLVNPQNGKCSNGSQYSVRPLVLISLQLWENIKFMHLLPVAMLEDLLRVFWQAWASGLRLEIPDFDADQLLHFIYQLPFADYHLHPIMSQPGDSGYRGNIEES